MSDAIDALAYTLRALQPPPVDAAGVLFRDHLGRFMLLSSPYKAHVDLPGGMVDAGETPLQAAIREVHEELGITLREPLRLLVADYLEATPTRPRGTRWVFYGGLVGRGRHEVGWLQAGEVDEIFWCDRFRVMQLLTYHAPMLERRVQAAIWAVKSGISVEMTNGWVSGSDLMRSLAAYQPPKPPPVTTS